MLLFPKLSSVEFFIIGAIAKAVATIITYPLQTIQSILQVGFLYMHPGGMNNFSIFNNCQSQMKRF